MQTSFFRAKCTWALPAGGRCLAYDRVGDETAATLARYHFSVPVFQVHLAYIDIEKQCAAKKLELRHLKGNTLFVLTLCILFYLREKLLFAIFPSAIINNITLSSKKSKLFYLTMI